jgi:hypothetical protein
VRPLGAGRLASRIFARACIGPIEYLRSTGKLAHRTLSLQQASAMRLAIANNRKVRKLLRDWATETERLIDAELPRDR